MSCIFLKKYLLENNIFMGKLCQIPFQNDLKLYGQTLPRSSSSSANYPQVKRFSPGQKRRKSGGKTNKLPRFFPFSDPGNHSHHEPSDFPFLTIKRESKRCGGGKKGEINISFLFFHPPHLGKREKAASCVQFSPASVFRERESFFTGNNRVSRSEPF